MVNQQFYTSPRRAAVASTTTLDNLLSDDFGGSTINGASWTVLDGGLAANQGLGGPNLSQAKIGSGITGMTDNVSGSALNISMGTVLGAERWYLSNRTFAGKEDILVILSKSQSLAANSIFIGLVEVDTASEVPLLNTAFGADSNGSGEFTNRGGCEFGLTATNTAYQAEAIGDASASKAVGVQGITAAAWNTAQEALIEIDARDITVSTTSVDAVTAKASGASRVSSQCPNDTRLYKLLMRFRNVAAPGSNTSVAIQRIVVADNYEQRVQLSTGEGDTIGNKAIAVNVVGGTGGLATPLGSVMLNVASTSAGTPTRHKLISAATTNATSVKTSSGRISGGFIANISASTRYFKIFNKASAPALGTDTPTFTFPLISNQAYYVADMFTVGGSQFSTGIAYAITANVADTDNTAIAANDVVVNLEYF